MTKIFVQETDYEQSVDTSADLLSTFFGPEFESDGTWMGTHHPMAVLGYIPELKPRLERAAGENRQYLEQAFKKIMQPHEFHLFSPDTTKMPVRETAEEFAQRNWPTNQEAREAFTVGLTWMKERSDQWTEDYNALKFAAARASAAVWVVKMEEDIAKLAALDPEERMQVLEKRIASCCNNFRAEREYYGDNGHW